MYRMIRYYPVSGHEIGYVGWIWYTVFGKIRYPVLSGILDPVEFHIRYYPVDDQLMSNTGATDFHGMYNLWLMKCTLNL